MDSRKIRSGETLTQKLSRHAIELSADTISESAFSAARRALTDTVGCGVRGSRLPPAQAVRDALHLSDIQGRFACFDGTYTQSAYQAAFINGTAAHSLELDDTDAQGLTHPGVVIIPAALATAQNLPRTTFQDLLVAIIVGYDVAVRLSRWVNPEHRMRGFHTTATVTALGAVASVARLRGFTVEQCVSAMGVALSSASGSFEFVTDGSNLKRVHAGKSAASAIQACDLALSGVEGPQNSLQGTYGFYSTSVSDKPKILDLSDLGSVFSIEQVGTKRHACCRFCHTAIDVAIDVYNQGVRVSETSAVSVAVSSLCHSQTGNGHPTNELQRQFSTPFGVALGLLTGTTKLGDYQESPNQDVMRLASRIRMVVDPRLEPQDRQATIDVLTGSTHVGHMRLNPRGEQDSPFTPAEMKRKFLDLVCAVTTQSAANELFEILHGTASDESLEHLWTCLADCSTYEALITTEGEPWKATPSFNK